jgi:MOSC domain-containing protein YiiM
MGKVLAVHKSQTHSFSKQTAAFISLIQGEGVAGDAHRGVTVKHRSRVRQDPTQPNLRQVHLIHYELIEELQEKGFRVQPGTMGENITTQGIDLLSLPTDTILVFPDGTEVLITGLRNPCSQLDSYQKGLTSAVLDRDPHGKIIRKAGVMGIVKTGGEIYTDDPIKVILPPEPHKNLERV